MRNILSDIKAKQPNRYYETALMLTWEKALNFGKEDRNIDDSWEQKLATEWAKRLGKAFGSKLAMQPKVAAMALELYSEKLVTDLNEYWEGYDPEQHEADDNDAF
jgi:hypothetical protein